MDFFLLLLVSLSSMAGYLAIQRIPTPKPSPAKPITPDSSIITFDIHGVLFTADWRKIIGRIWANKKSCTLIVYIFNPRFVYHLFKLWHKGAVLEKCITALSENYPFFARHKNFIFMIANTQKPIPHMLDLIKTLKSHGYTLHIFSNIGTQLFQDLAQDFPQEFMLFDKAFTPDGFKGKSHQETFSYYLEEFNPENKQVLFIDNNKKNITLAKTVGIISIYYKNPQQLHAALKQLRVL